MGIFFKNNFTILHKVFLYLIALNYNFILTKPQNLLNFFVVMKKKIVGNDVRKSSKSLSKKCGKKKCYFC